MGAKPSKRGSMKKGVPPMEGSGVPLAAAVLGGSGDAAAEDEDDQELRDGRQFEEPICALVQNCTVLHNIVGPACIFLRQSFAQAQLFQMEDTPKTLVAVLLDEKEICKKNLHLDASTCLLPCAAEYHRILKFNADFNEFIDTDLTEKVETLDKFCLSRLREVDHMHWLHQRTQMKLVQVVSRSYPCNEQKWMLAESVGTLFPSLKIKMGEENEGFSPTVDLLR